MPTQSSTAGVGASSASARITPKASRISCSACRWTGPAKAGCWRAVTISTPHRGSAPMADASPGSPGITRTCPGTAPNFGSANSATTAAWPAPNASPAAATSRSMQPEWSPDGVLHFVSDRTGWWNLYRWRGGDGVVEPLAPMEAEFGRPQWVFGNPTYAFLGNTRLALLVHAGAASGSCATLDTESGTLTPIKTAIRRHRRHPGGRGPGRICRRRRHRGDRRGSPRHRHRPERGPEKREHRSTSMPATCPRRRRSSFPRKAAATAHAFYYAPRNRDFTGPARERPPLLVCSHGGPTSATSAHMRLEYQYWTSRGFAVLDVNYGGSTGYGREYRERLKATWGITDVDDCVNGARALVERKLADPCRLAIRGGSAGGYTTLCAPHLPQRLRRRRQLLRRQRPRGPRPRNPQVRVPLPRRPDRPLSRTARPVHRPARRSISPTGSPAR